MELGLRPFRLQDAPAGYVACVTRDALQLPVCLIRPEALLRWAIDQDSDLPRADRFTMGDVSRARLPSVAHLIRWP
jgi:hypothetical protein